MSATSPTKDAITAFDETTEAYFSVWCRLHPVASVDMGVYDYADRLRPYGDDDHTVLVSLNERLLKGLEEVDPRDLDADRALNHQLMLGGAYLELDWLMRQDWRHRDPERFLPIESIYQLLLHPIPNKMQALSSRLAAIPDYLRQSTSILKEHIDTVSPVWLASAMDSVRSGTEFIAALTDNPRLNDEAQAADAPNIMFLLAGVNDALSTFIHVLEDAVAPKASGEFACGERRFNALLKYRHGLSIDAVQLRAFGEQLIKHTQRDLKRVTESITGREDVLGLAERLHADHTNARGLVPAYRQTADVARRFVVDNELVTIPDSHALVVEETPMHLRHVFPFAHYVRPAANDSEQVGSYFVTPVDDEETLARHDHRTIRHTTAQQVWPGRHLQAVVANHNPYASALPRLFNAASTMRDGWAMYSEQLMFEAGYLKGSEHEFLLLFNRLWRAMCVVADVDLHVNNASIEDVAQGFTETLGFSPGQAKAEVTRFTRRATDSMGHACGWALIMAARDRLRAEQPELTALAFHDQLLNVGPIAPPLALAHAFGRPLSDTVTSLVFA